MKTVTSTSARALLALAVLLGSAVPAIAGPRLVRVIWDVGSGVLYYRVESRVTAGQDAFTVPRNGGEAVIGEHPFTLVNNANVRFLQKGDSVRIYVVNYNPVAHAWSDSASTVEQVALAQDLIGPILNATVLAITGAGKFPPQFTVKTAVGGPEPTVGACSQLNTIRTDLGNFLVSAKNVYDKVDGLLKQEQNVATQAKAITGIPKKDEIRNEFNDLAAWAKVVSILGYDDFEKQNNLLLLDVKTAKDSIDEATKHQRKLDLAIAELGQDTLPSNCTDNAKALLQQRDAIIDLLHQIVGPDSDYVAFLAKLNNAQELFNTYRRQLATPSWTSEAVELIVKDAIKPDSVLRLDGVFVSVDKSITARQQRNVVMGVTPDFPVLLITAGMGGNRLDLKQLQVVKVPVTAADGTVSAKDQFQIVDDHTVEQIVPVWLESIRILSAKNVGIYGTFGTTPDRNIFKNAIWGGTVFVPRIRTAFTVGQISIRGYSQTELEKVASDYSDASGFVLTGVTAANVKLPDAKRKTSLLFSVSFVLVSF